MNLVFVDTSALFAALVRNDVMHAQAAATLDRLLELGVDLHASSYVLLETLAILQSRVGLDAARSVEHDLRPLFQITWIDESLHDRAFRRLEMRARRDVSLVDCASFVVMEEIGITAAFAYDADFAEEGFTTIGTPDDID